MSAGLVGAFIGNQATFGGETAGYDPIIPLETILAMMKTGEKMPSELRCTCKGGLCITETGKRIADEINKNK